MTATTPPPTDRQQIIDQLRNDTALWGYLCGAIAPKDATTGALRAALQLAAEWLEECDG
jgi:hypothetical protein